MRCLLTAKLDDMGWKTVGTVEQGILMKVFDCMKSRSYLLARVAWICNKTKDFCFFRRFDELIFQLDITLSSI